MKLHRTKQLDRIYLIYPSKIIGISEENED